VILCICLSPAIDVTYTTSELVVGGSNRVGSVLRRPGGKAVNVARVLQTLGESVHVLAPTGGAAGAEYEGALDVEATFVRSGLPTRQTLAVVHGSTGVTIFLEPAVIDCWSELLAAASDLIRSCNAVVISGALPRGAATDAFGVLVRLARAADRPVIVDTSGAALVDALSAGPTMVKPNADELTALTGDLDPAEAARLLARTHDTTVVASLGPTGVAAASATGSWLARPGQVLKGNATGAGDALVAGLARAVAKEHGVPADFASTLRDAVALSAAAVLSPVAGEVELSEYEHQRAGVTVQVLGDA
jgi:tagatose 6-phosphate kinase